MKPIKITYIGGGSRQWARNLISDLALEKRLRGEVVLHDIDHNAALDNQRLGQLMMQKTGNPKRWQFRAERDLRMALKNADFVFISILPGTFDTMHAYVHEPEKWGIYQSVGDTVGPAGIFRALIMMPMYHTFAKAIEAICPDAWVVNFTNPMTLCVQMLYHAFPKIKAFGNCHEVFFVQRILARALKEQTGIEVPYHAIQINPKGLNHFTWIDYASYQNRDLIPIYRAFAEKYHAEGLHGDDWVHVGPFGSAERVKLDLFLQHNIIAAAGDRHLVEFLPQDMYLTDLETIKSWRFYLTPVALRQTLQQKRSAQTKAWISDPSAIQLEPSGEEGIAQIKALLGLEPLTTNVNLPNQGQIPNLPLGHIVETNALFRYNDLRPIFAGALTGFPKTMTDTHIKIHRLLLQAYDQKSLAYAYEALTLDPLSAKLSKKALSEMFHHITRKLEPYLDHYKPL